MKSKFKIKTKMKAARRVAACALLLVLLLPGAIALSQSDNFFYIDESEYRGGDDVGTGSWLGIGDNTGGTGSWLGFGENTGGEASWEGFEEGNPLPTGTGLLVMALSGACYAGAKVKRGARSVKRVVGRD